MGAIHCAHRPGRAHRPGHCASRRGTRDDRPPAHGLPLHPVRHADPKVAFAELEPHEPGFVERRIIRILQEKYVKTMPTESMRIRVARERQLENGREVRYLDRGGLGAPKTKPRRA